MAQNITLMGASYSAVPGVTLPKTGGGTALFVDNSDVTAAAGDIVSGKAARSAAGALVNGSLVIQHYYTGTGAPSSSLGANGDIYLRTS